jgi:hypothetical protein
MGRAGIRDFNMGFFFELGLIFGVLECVLKRTLELCGQIRNSLWGVNGLLRVPACDGQSWPRGRRMFATIERSNEVGNNFFEFLQPGGGVLRAQEIGDRR